MSDFVAIVVTFAVFVLLALVAKGAGEAVSAANVIGLVLSIVVTVFLVVALLYPEKF